MRFQFGLYAFFSFLALLFGSGAFAQDFRIYAGEFMQLGVGARSLALGSAAIAYVNDASVGYWNPAGLANINYPSVTGMHESRFAGAVEYDVVAVAAPLGALYGAGLTIVHTGITDIKDTRGALVDNNGNGKFDQGDFLDYNRVSSFGNYDWGILLSLGRQGDSTFSYGSTLKLLFRKLDPQNSATGVGIDIGVRYRLTKEFTLAAVGQDITTTILAYSSDTKELVAPTLKVGGAYVWDIAGDSSHKIMPTADINLHLDGRGVGFNVGAEYQLAEVLALRGGYDNIGRVTFGAGIKLPKLLVDYAFVGFSSIEELGDLHRISFSLTLEQNKWKR
jgi:hypothetical protein